MLRSSKIGFRVFSDFEMILVAKSGNDAFGIFTCEKVFLNISATSLNDRKPAVAMNLSPIKDRELHRDKWRLIPGRFYYFL